MLVLFFFFFFFFFFFGFVGSAETCAGSCACFGYATQAHDVGQDELLVPIDGGQVVPDGVADDEAGEEVHGIGPISRRRPAKAIIICTCAGGSGGGTGDALGRDGLIAPLLIVEAYQILGLEAEATEATEATEAATQAQDAVDVGVHILAGACGRATMVRHLLCCR